MTGTGSAEAAVERTLQRLVSRLREAGGDNVLGIAAYGAIVKGRYVAGMSDLSLLLVLADASLDALALLAPCLTAAMRQAQVVSFVVTPADLREAAHLFPVKILDIQCRHRLLYGDLHLAGLTVDPDSLRLRALQECRNLELKLRQRVVERGAEPEALWAALVATLPRFVLLLETVLRARGFEVPEARQELLGEAGRALGLDVQCLEGLNTVHRRGPRPTDEVVRGRLTDLFSLVRELAAWLASPPRPPAACA